MVHKESLYGFLFTERSLSPFEHDFDFYFIKNAMLDLATLTPL
jgi:hypothetical protein